MMQWELEWAMGSRYFGLPAGNPSYLLALLHRGGGQLRPVCMHIPNAAGYWNPKLLNYDAGGLYLTPSCLRKH